jgi:arginase
MPATLVTVPYHLGRPRFGPGLGPEQLARWALADFPDRDLDVRPVELPIPFQHEVGASFALAASLAEEVRVARLRGRRPVVLAGNCVSCVGTLAALSPGAVGIVWLDAHGDLNTPDTTSTGFLDGMALSTAIGRSWRGLAEAIPGFEPVTQDNVVLVGGRAMDPAEIDLVRVGAITHVSEAHVRSVGPPAALRAAFEELRARVDRIYLHVDLDVLDPDELVANQWQESGGLRVQELQEAVATAIGTFHVAAVGVTAFDPTFDPTGDAREPLRRVLERILAVPAGTAAAVD